MFLKPRLVFAFLILLLLFTNQTIFVVYLYAQSSVANFVNSFVESTPLIVDLSYFGARFDSIMFLAYINGFEVELPYTLLPGERVSINITVDTLYKNKSISKWVSEIGYENLVKELSKKENRRYLKDVDIVLNSYTVEDTSTVVVFIPSNARGRYPVENWSLKALKKGFLNRAIIDYNGFEIAMYFNNKSKVSTPIENLLTLSTKTIYTVINVENGEKIIEMVIDGNKLMDRGKLAKISRSNVKAVEKAPKQLVEKIAKGDDDPTLYYYRPWESSGVVGEVTSPTSYVYLGKFINATISSYPWYQIDRVTIMHNTSMCYLRIFIGSLNVDAKIPITININGSSYSYNLDVFRNKLSDIYFYIPKPSNSQYFKPKSNLSVAISIPYATPSNALLKLHANVVCQAYVSSSRPTNFVYVAEQKFSGGGAPDDGSAWDERYVLNRYTGDGVFFIYKNLDVFDDIPADFTDITVESDSNQRYDRYVDIYIGFARGPLVNVCSGVARGSSIANGTAGVRTFTCSAQQLKTNAQYLVPYLIYASLRDSDMPIIYVKIRGYNNYDSYWFVKPFKIRYYARMSAAPYIQPMWLDPTESPTINSAYIISMQTYSYGGTSKWFVPGKHTELASDVFAVEVIRPSINEYDMLAVFLTLDAVGKYTSTYSESDSYANIAYVVGYLHIVINVTQTGTMLSDPFVNAYHKGISTPPQELREFLVASALSFILNFVPGVVGIVIGAASWIIESLASCIPVCTTYVTCSKPSSDTVSCVIYWKNSYITCTSSTSGICSEDLLRGKLYIMPSYSPWNDNDIIIKYSVTAIYWLAPGSSPVTGNIWNYFVGELRFKPYPLG